MGLRAITPQYAAGRSVEPVVWLPRAAGTIPEPTAAAEPALKAIDASDNYGEASAFPVFGKKRQSEEA